MNKYLIFKLFHIVGMIFWLGPSTGGFFLIAKSNLARNAQVELWMREEYRSLIHIETVGLIMIIMGGVGMVIASRGIMLKLLWFRIKGGVTLAIFIPLALYQLYLYETSLKSAFAAGENIENAIAAYDRFSAVAFVLLMLSVPLVMVMGVFKPGGDGLKT